MALSDGVFEIGPTVVRFAHRPDAAPILLLGHGMGAVPMFAALDCARAFRTIDAIELGLVFDPIVDVLSLSASTARTIRVDFAEAVTASSKRGEPASHEVIIELTGEHADRGRGRFRYELVDLEGYAALSARGIAIAIERSLGLAGRPAPKAGLYFPETIMDPHSFVSRLQDLGVTIQQA